MLSFGLQFPKLFSETWYRAAIPANAGFRATGIFPYNIFSESAFAPRSDRFQRSRFRKFQRSLQFKAFCLLQRLKEKLLKNQGILKQRS